VITCKIIGLIQFLLMEVVMLPLSIGTPFFLSSTNRILSKVYPCLANQISSSVCNPVLLITHLVCVYAFCERSYSDKPSPIIKSLLGTLLATLIDHVSLTLIFMKVEIHTITYVQFFYKHITSSSIVATISIRR
jgi:hypothetical protein